MKQTDLIRLIAENMNDNTMDKLFPYLAPDCVYVSSGRLRASGEEEVKAFMLKRKNAQTREGVAVFSWPAVIVGSGEESLPVGTPCAAFCQYDPYNCVGFMTAETDPSGKIGKIAFHTTPDVVFRVSKPKKDSVTKVPRDAHEAVCFRAFAYGITENLGEPDRQRQARELFRERVGRILDHVTNDLFEGFNEGIENAAGYLYAAAMSEAVEERTGAGLFPFDASVSTGGTLPALDGRYEKWIEEGRETGKKLFFGFMEYVNMRSPEERTFEDQLRQSYLDVAVCGLLQARRDLDRGVPVRIRPGSRKERPSGDPPAGETGPSELRTVTAALAAEGSAESARRFADVLRRYVTEGVWVHVPCKEEGDRFRLAIGESRGMRFAKMFSDPAEIRSSGGSVVMTDINRFLDPVFHEPEIDGVVIDPGTTGLCLQKAFLLECILLSGYPRQNNAGGARRDWGFGIPEYLPEDLMTPEEILNFAMQTVVQYECTPEKGYRTSAGCDTPGAMPNLILTRDKGFAFVCVKGYVAEEEPELTAAEREELLRIARTYGGTAFWAPVGFRSCDPLRFTACLALRGDKYYAKYQGLREVGEQEDAGERPSEKGLKS